MFKVINNKKELNEFFENNSNTAKLYNINTVATCGFYDGGNAKIKEVFPMTSFVADYSSNNTLTITSRYFDYIARKYKLLDYKRVDVNKEKQQIRLIRHDGNFIMLSDFWSSGELAKDMAEWIMDKHM